jgi:diguanylate cyclase (GGDEF)-like protein/PAS domain S-box-containing protein
MLILALLLVAGAGSIRSIRALRFGATSTIEAFLMLGLSLFGAFLLVFVSFALLKYASRRKLTEQRLSDLLTTAEQTGDLITILDRRGRIAYVNHAVEETTGFLRSELLGRRSSTWFPWYRDKRFMRELQKTVLSGKPFRATLEAVKKNGEPLYLDETVTPLPDEQGKVRRVISTARNISERKALSDRIAFLDNFDPLTGLPNRAQFVRLLEEACKTAMDAGHFLSLLLIDIDRFKLINDMNGMATGDELLQRVAGKIRETVVTRDIVARLGSDEFAVVHFDDTAPVDSPSVAEQLRVKLSQKQTIGGNDIVVSVTTGIAIFPDHGMDAQTLLTNADLALARAKSRGRNSVLLYESAIGSSIAEFYVLEKSLFSALKNDEYQVHYQPYCDLGTKKCTGAEALIRWKNRELGVVSAAKFVPSLEDTGLIIEVGRWVLETACSQIRDMELKNRSVPVSVNLSLIQFRHKHLVSLVNDVVRNSRLDPRHLTLEVTESAFMHDMDFAITTLKRLKDVGVSLSVDDFGTGYSSLSYLKRLPVDNVKIDISFVRDVAKDQDTASIVTAIATLARSLGLKTIAEGVETEQQRHILHLLRCDMGQGYYFSPAIPAQEFNKFLE